MRPYFFLFLESRQPEWIISVCSVTFFSVCSLSSLLKQQGFSEDELHAFQGWWTLPQPSSSLQRLCETERERVDFNLCLWELKGTLYFYAPRTWWCGQQTTPPGYYVSRLFGPSRTKTEFMKTMSWNVVKVCRVKAVKYTEMWWDVL